MNYKFELAAPVSLMLNSGNLGFWSRDPSTRKHFVSLDPTQASILLQFALGPRSPAEAAASACVDYDSNLEELIKEFVRFQVLRENPGMLDVPFHRFYHPDVDESERICLVEPQAFDKDRVMTMAASL